MMFDREVDIPYDVINVCEDGKLFKSKWNDFTYEVIGYNPTFDFSDYETPIYEREPIFNIIFRKVATSSSNAETYFQDYKEVRSIEVGFFVNNFYQVSNVVESGEYKHFENGLYERIKDEINKVPYQIDDTLNLEKSWG